jgi:uncharacterized protein YecT (DUF1311 family)
MDLNGKLRQKSHYDDEQCQSKRLQELDAGLNRVYKQALAVKPENEETRLCKSREQLRRPQKTWLAYINEECALEGGMEGGSNDWVSTFASSCEEKDFKSRIELLKSIANETFEEKFQGQGKSLALTLSTSKDYI